MRDITERLDALYVQNGTSYVQEAAAEIKRLRAENERLRAGGCARGQRTTQWCAEAVALQQEVAALRADAERYRWLRDSAWTASVAEVVQRHRNKVWDEVIDAARAGGE